MIQSLPTELFLTICPFLLPKEVLSIALTCKDFSVVFEAESSESNILWKQFCEFYTRVPVELDNHPNYLAKFKSTCLISFNTTLPSPISRLEFSNSNLTCHNRRPASDNDLWELIRSNMALLPGRIYEFEFVLEHMEKLPSNSWMIVAGISSDSRGNFTRKTTEYYGPWLGSEPGVGMILYSGSFSCNGRIYPDEQHPSDNYPNLILETGDVVGLRVDRVSPDPTVAKVEFFLNGELYSKSPFHIAGEEIYYPAVSLENQQAISIRYGLTLKNKAKH